METNTSERMKERVERLVSNGDYQTLLEDIHGSFVKQRIPQTTAQTVEYSRTALGVAYSALLVVFFKKRGEHKLLDDVSEHVAALMDVLAAWIEDQDAKVHSPLSEIAQTESEVES